MAVAEQMMVARYGDDLVDHRTYVIAGDGCLMEGISHETASLAGHLKLSRLTLLFDDNGISIDGPTNLTVSDDQGARFEALGWHVQHINGHDPAEIAKAITSANADPRPSMIACQTTIGYGAPNKQGTAATHGAPLGPDEVAAARLALKWPHPPFEIPALVLEQWRQVGRRGGEARRAWQTRLEGSTQRGNFEGAIAGLLPNGWSDALNTFKEMQIASAEAVATRKASESVLEIVNREIPNTVGGSADLTGSNNTKTKNMVAVTATNFGGNYIYYGVREHAMAGAMNGIALHGGLLPYGGTFLVFSDYARPAMRLSALMGLRVVYVMTHDSIGLGEDGPTHQPVEHLAALRAIPNLSVFRPADAVETAECWELALSRNTGPSVLVLTRQNLPIVRQHAKQDNPCADGAYEILSSQGAAVVTLLATGSEVAIAAETRDLLQAANIPTRVVSMPCWELIENLDSKRRETLLGGESLRVGIEAAVRSGWDRWLGKNGMFFGMTGFGASAPYKDLYDHFGLTAPKIAKSVQHHLDTSTTDQKG
jgi:transketolase